MLLSAQVCTVPSCEKGSCIQNPEQKQRPVEGNLVGEKREKKRRKCKKIDIRTLPQCYIHGRTFFQGTVMMRPLSAPLSGSDWDVVQEAYSISYLPSVSGKEISSQ
jgi:hypothetical protein